MDPQTQAAIDEILKRNRKLVQPKTAKKNLSECGKHLKKINLRESNHVHAYHGRSKNPESRHVDVSELYIDFIFVFPIIALQQQFLVDPTENVTKEIQFEQFLNYFAIIYLLWKDLMTYQSLFSNDDVIHRLANVFYGFGICGLGLSIDGGWENGQNLAVFCWFAFGINLFMMILYTRVYFNIKNAVAESLNPEREMYREAVAVADITRRQMWFIIQALIWVLSAFQAHISMERTRIFMWLNVALYFVYDFGSGFCIGMEKILHPHCNHYSERMNAFTLIIIGASLFALFTRDDDLAGTEMAYHYNFALAYLVLFGLKLLNLDRDKIMQDEHALTQGYWNRICWIYSQLFASAGIALVGEAMIILLKSMTSDYYDDAHLMYSNGYAAALLFNFAGRCCHKFNKRTGSCNPLLALFSIEMVFQFGIAVLAFCMPFLLSHFTVSVIAESAPFLYVVCSLFVLVFFGLIPEFTMHCGCTCCDPEQFQYANIPESTPLLN